MLTDLDETIQNLLRDELPIKNSEIDIKFDQPKREWSARLNKPTINFFLYDVRENVTLRQHQKFTKVQNGSHNSVNFKRMPYRVDCSYMMTVWASEPDDEHRLLTRTMMALMRFPILPEEKLVGQMQNPSFDIQAKVAAHDKLTNPSEIWGALDNEIRPAVPFVVTIAIDPWQETTTPLVRSYTIRSGIAEGEPREEEMAELAAEKTYIGGHVVNKDGEPQENIEIAIKGTGHLTTTDKDGKFVMGSIDNGDYTLIAWPPKGRPKQQKLVVPSPDGTYDMVL